MLMDRARGRVEGIIGAGVAVAIGVGYLAASDRLNFDTKTATPAAATAPAPGVSETTLPALPAANTTATTPPAPAPTPSVTKLPNTGWECTGPEIPVAVDMNSYFSSTNQFSILKAVKLATGDARISDLPVAPVDVAHAYARDVAYLNNINLENPDNFPQGNWKVLGNCKDPSTQTVYIPR